MDEAQSRIRNFCIIAHIDHGKSTLADRFLELTGTVEGRNMHGQLLDTMDIEQERGITIKLQPVRMLWHPKQQKAISNTQKGLKIADSEPYVLNLIDTPGHVDFSYEVSRSLAACEGAIVVVDATQGVQAQTLSNIALAKQAKLKLIPVVNKIDLPAAEPDRVAAEIAKLLDTEAKDVIRLSAKTGEGVEDVLRAVIEQVPPPGGSEKASLKALVFDSVYDSYRGVVLYLRVFSGSLKKGARIKLMNSSSTAEALEVGYFAPKPTPADELSEGQIGYAVTNLRSTAQGSVGDTVTSQSSPATTPLAGYKLPQAFVYVSFFPPTNDKYQELKDALEKLKLNDSALTTSPENSKVLGFGFRIGFLGLLHMEIIKERILREYELDVIATSPSTTYQVVTTAGETITLNAPHEMPEASQISAIKEPWIRGKIIVPKNYLGAVLSLITNLRGYQTDLSYPSEETALLEIEAPLANTISGFYDALKSATRGYGSFSYEPVGFREGKLVRLDVLIAGDKFDSLSQIVHSTEAQAKSRQLLAKLKDIIPRQLFEVSLQAAIGGKIIAREDVRALGKNVTGHLYGGDITRKRKLWEKQKKGKKRMKKFGKVDIPPEAFTALIKDN